MPHAPLSFCAALAGLLCLAAGVEPGANEPARAAEAVGRHAHGDSPGQASGGLFFREDWRETPPETPITQAHVANPELILTLHGPGRAGIKKSHHPQPADDPYYVWSGEAEGNWAVSLRHRSRLADLSGPAKIRWRSKQSGFRQLRVVLKLADGAWLVSEQSDGESQDWHVKEFQVASLKWRKLDIAKIIEGAPCHNPDLSRVEEIGCTDLMVGGGSAACSRLDWIEVYGQPQR
ncbi:MAG: hypothetical protein ABSG68_13965 [Thermoguttaceae bacterium]|jgi:hypothetical protein